jgi:cytochrome P450
MRQLDSYDLFDPATAEDPFEYYAALRQQSPVYQMPSGMWIVASHALCLEAIRDVETFSNKFIQAMMGGGGAGNGEIVGPETLLSNDPPSHTYFRKLVNKAFSPNRVKKLSASISEIARDLMLGIEGRSNLEAVSEFAVPLPLTVIADQLGVPRADLASFKKWSDATIVPLSGMATPEQVMESMVLVQELQAYFVERIEERRAQPQDDMLSDLVQAPPDGERPIETKEVVSLLQQFLVAGNETTTNLISAALQFLLQHPDQLAKVKANPSLLPNAIEEAIRLETPVCGMWRVATRDTEFGGQKIAAGNMVMLRYASANRDEAVFEDPDRFDVERANARDHLGFGMGIHYCPGAALAREETRIGLELLFDRLPNLRLTADNDFAHHPNALLRGLKRLNLAFDRP